MKWIAPLFSIACLAFSCPANASLCEAIEGNGDAVDIRYIGNVHEKVATGFDRKLRITNDSDKSFAVAAYAGVRPLRAYPVDIFLEVWWSETWSPVLQLPNFARPAEAIKINPGKKYEFLFLGPGEVKPEELYRIKLKETGDCWITSEPFHFKPNKK